VMGVAPQPILTRSEKSVEAFAANYRDRLQDSRRAPDAPAHVYPSLTPPAASPAAPPPAPVPPPPLPPPPPAPPTPEGAAP
jgi:hypothetical protein